MLAFVVVLWSSSLATRCTLDPEAVSPLRRKKEKWGARFVCFLTRLCFVCTRTRSSLYTQSGDGGAPTYLTQMTRRARCYAVVNLKIWRGAAAAVFYAVRFEGAWRVQWPRVTPSGSLGVCTYRSPCGGCVWNEIFDGDIAWKEDDLDVMQLGRFFGKFQANTTAFINTNTIVVFVSFSKQITNAIVFFVYIGWHLWPWVDCCFTLIISIFSIQQRFI